MPIGAMVKKISSLKREIKRAKLFEVQRLVRRLRQLAIKKGTETQRKKNQRKVERLEKELEFLKDVEVNEIVRRITSNEGEGDEKNVAGEDRGEDSRVDMDLQKRALDRIINSTKLQKFLYKVDASNEDSSSAAAASEKGSSDVKALRLNHEQKGVKQKIKTKASDCARGKPQLKEKAKDGDSYCVSAELPKVKEQQQPSKLKLMATMAVTCEPELQTDDDENGGSSDVEVLFSKKQKVKEDDEDSEDDGFLPSSGISESDFEEDIDDMSSPELKPKGLQSCFVQSMSKLTKEKHSKAKNKEGKEKGKPGNGKGKRNRKGQRARQQMWEKVHGKSAKHLQKSSKTGVRSKDIKEARKVNTQHSLKRRTHVGETLHPSWEAMKKKRSQETLKVEFKGQKIKFDDSE